MVYCINILNQFITYNRFLRFVQNFLLLKVDKNVERDWILFNFEIIITKKYQNNTRLFKRLRNEEIEMNNAKNGKYELFLEHFL